MLRTNPFVAIAVFMLFAFQAASQNDDAARVEGLVSEDLDSIGWNIGGGIGLDLGQVTVINPRAGSGQNRWGIGGAVGLYANYKKDRITWKNNFVLNLAVEKTGSGVLPDTLGNPTKTKVPFRKSIDELRLNSTFGYSFAEGSKWSYAASFGLRTQLLPSYQGLTDGQIYVSEVTEEGPYQNALVSKFFAPARFAVGLGVLYEPNANFSVTFTPLTADVIVITDQAIADLGVHGTKLEDGSDTVYKKTRFAFGATLSAQYQRKWWDDRFGYATKLTLFTDYLDNPQNIDILWTQEIAVTIVKGLQLTFNTNLFYDDDVLSNETDFDDVGGIARNPDGSVVLGPRVNYYHQILLKYVWQF